MCHEQFHRVRPWDREMSDDVDDPLADEWSAEASADDLPSFLNDAEPDEDVELLTDGGDK